MQSHVHVHVWLEKKKIGRELDLVIWRSLQCSAQFKITNIFAVAIVDQTTKFNSCQYNILSDIVVKIRTCLVFFFLYKLYK